MPRCNIVAEVFTDGLHGITRWRWHCTTCDVRSERAHCERCEMWQITIEQHTGPSVPEWDREWSDDDDW